MYYAVFLFQQAGLASTTSSLLANGLQGVVLNVFTWINMWYIDSWGRRWPMILGAVAMGISMMLIGVIMVTQGALVEHSFYFHNAYSCDRKSRLRPAHAKNEFRLHS
jgi:Sugar (and other) transporter